MTEALIIGLLTIVGVTAQRIVGFGGGMFIMPALLIYFSAPTSVAVTLYTGSVFSALLLYRDRYKLEVSKAIVLRIFITAIPGSLLGAYVVTQVEKAWLQIVLGLLIVATVLIQEYVFPKPTKKLKADRRIPLVGVSAGFLNGAAAMAPIPIILWMRAHIITPNQVRHNLALVFILVNSISIGTIASLQSEIFNKEVVSLCLLILPLILIGTLIGEKWASKVNLKMYRKMVFVAILLAATFSFLAGAVSLIQTD